MSFLKEIVENKVFVISVSVLLVLALVGVIVGVVGSSDHKDANTVQSVSSEAHVDGHDIASENSSSTILNTSNVSKVSKEEHIVSNSSVTESKTIQSSSSNPNNSRPEWVDKDNSGKIDMTLLTKPNVGDKVCYLTFDDGPSANTLKILDILKQANAKASFFVIGTSKLDYIKRADGEGHTIGLHANNHDYSKIYKSDTAYFNDLAAISKKVQALIGKESKIIRFPGGSSNTTSKDYSKGIMRRLTKAVGEKGYLYVDWNVDSGDASGNRVAVSKLISNIKRGVKGKGDICVLMHDTGAKGTTVEALPQIICYLRGLGYRFEALTIESSGFHHGVNN